MSRTIDTLGLRPRTLRALQAAGIVYAADLAAMRTDALRAIPGIGDRALVEILARLEQHQIAPALGVGGAAAALALRERQLRERVALATLAADPDPVMLEALLVWADWLGDCGDARAERLARGIALAREPGGSVEYRSGYSCVEPGAEVVFRGPPPAPDFSRPPSEADERIEIVVRIGDAA